MTLEFGTTGHTRSGPEDVHDNREINRRNAVSKTRVFVKIFFNGKEVCQTSSKSLGSNEDFVVHIGQIFPIQIMQWPETLLLQVLESSGGLRGTIVLAEVQVPLCEAGKTLDKVATEPTAFKSSIRIAHDHGGLGALVEFPTNPDGSSISSEPICGQIYTKIGWGKSPDGVVLSPSPQSWKPPNVNRSDPLREVMDGEGNVDPSKLEAWIVKSQIDPNDPDNDELMSRVAEARRRVAVTDGSGTAKGSYFRLDQHGDQFVFGNMEDIDRNLRFKMLSMRRMKVPEFKNYRMIPSTEKEIPKGIIEAREKRVVANRKELFGSGDPVRGASRLFMEQLRSQVSHRFSLARHRRRHGDVVIEEPIPDLSTLVMLFGEMVPTQRPLRPIRMERKKVLMQDITGQDLKILLTVVRAYDVPVRVENDPMQRASSSNLQPSGSRDQMQEASVRTFVEARFQGKSARTTVAEGPNPAWNQQLKLNFSSPNNDYSAETLGRVKDNLHLHLFDEVTVDLIEEEQDRSSHVHQRLEKKWLGSMSIPFSSLYHNTRIEGTFRLHSPPVLLGYERSGSNIMSPQENTHKMATFLNVYLTIQPALIVPEPIKEKLDCDESTTLVQHCEAWTEEFDLTYPNRSVSLPSLKSASFFCVIKIFFFTFCEKPSVKPIIPCSFHIFIEKCVQFDKFSSN